MSRGRRTTAEAGYLAPPEVVGATFDGKAVAIEGAGAPGAQVRIAPPRGEPILVKADARGRWGAVLTPSQPVHLFGLSMAQGGRTAQAEGYIMLTAEGHVAQLRAGAGAVSLAPQSASPLILAIDYDRDGGAVVSGTASPAAALNLRIDRVRRGETKADMRGRFSISLPEPLAASTPSRWPATAAKTACGPTSPRPGRSGRGHTLAAARPSAGASTGRRRGAGCRRR